MTGTPRSTTAQRETVRSIARPCDQAVDRNVRPQQSGRRPPSAGWGRWTRYSAAVITCSAASRFSRSKLRLNVSANRTTSLAPSGPTESSSGRNISRRHFGRSRRALIPMTRSNNARSSRLRLRRLASGARLAALAHNGADSDEAVTKRKASFRHGRPEPRSSFGHSDAGRHSRRQALQETQSFTSPSSCRR